MLRHGVVVSPIIIHALPERRGELCAADYKHVLGDPNNVTQCVAQIEFWFYLNLFSFKIEATYSMVRLINSDSNFTAK